MKTLLSVHNLTMEFAVGDTALTALSDVSFELGAGEQMGVVGESGAGKSLLVQMIINMPPPAGKITAGEVWFDGSDLLTLSAEDIREVRGRRIATIFQDPMTSLNPVLTIGQQLTECLSEHGIASGAAAEKRAIEKLREVAIPSPAERLHAYPHELSGGMRQRIVIAAALMTDPDIIIADEPTTALDVTTQAEIMTLLIQLCQRRHMALILITHDLSLLAQTSDRILVMYSGLVIEHGATDDVVHRPQHPYTRGLLAALGKRGDDGKFFQIPGNMPSLAAIPDGCAFHPRCNYAADRCRRESPLLSDCGQCKVACHAVAEKRI